MSITESITESTTETIDMNKFLLSEGFTKYNPVSKSERQIKKPMTYEDAKKKIAESTMKSKSSNGWFIIKYKDINISYENFKMFLGGVWTLFQIYGEDFLNTG